MIVLFPTEMIPLCYCFPFSLEDASRHLLITTMATLAHFSLSPAVLSVRFYLIYQLSRTWSLANLNAESEAIHGACNLKAD